MTECIHDHNKQSLGRLDPGIDQVAQGQPLCLNATDIVMLRGHARPAWRTTKEMRSPWFEAPRVVHIRFVVMGDASVKAVATP
jgi:hypothetical protein